MPKVSIIIPIYKAKDTLPACLDSVLKQTIDSLEVLLVDDRSPDDSIDVARKYVSHYAGPIRFCFLETPVNGGPGVARNMGLTAATGEYVAFLDSDDTLEPTFCEKLYNAAVTAVADLACCDATQHQPSGSKRLRNPNFDSGPIDEGTRRRVLRKMVTYLWTYLFRREFLLENGIVFPPFRSAEDTCMVCCCWLSANSVARVDEPLYNYNVAPASLSARTDHGRWLQRLSSLHAFARYARAKGIYTRHRFTIRWLLFKKGRLLAAKDFIKNNMIHRSS